MGDLKLSDDGLYYWDGSRWISTLSPDGRWRWSGSAWVPVTGIVAPPYPYYRQPAAVRVPTMWTKPMQYAVAIYYGLSGLYTLSLPFWMARPMAQLLNQSIQRQVALSPDASPPPADLVASMMPLMSVVLWFAAVIGVAIAAVFVIGALKRWTWLFYVVLVLLGLGAASLPFNIASAISGSSSFNTYTMPSWLIWQSIAVGLPGAALFVWMLVAVIRHGPWAMARTS